MADSSASIRAALSNGLPIPEDIRTKLNELNLTAQAGTRDGNWLSIASVASTRIAPPLADSAKQALYRGVEGAAIGGAIGSVIPGIGTAGMAAYTAGTGAWIGFAESTYDQTYASSAFAYSQLKVDGALLDNETVNNAATMEAVISTSLDLASFKVLGGLFGSAGNSIRKIITSTLETPAGRKIFSELAKNVLKGTGKVAGAVAAESATEATQEIVLDAFGEMAKQWTSEKRGGDYEAQDILRPEVMDKAIDAGIEAAKATILLAGAPVTIPPRIKGAKRIIDHKAILNDEISHDYSFQTFIEVVHGMSSKDTESGRNAINDTLAQSGMDTSYLDPLDAQEAIDSLIETGINAENTEWVKTIQEGVDKAKRNGSSVQIPTIDMIHSLGEKGGEIFMDLISTNENLTAPKRRDEDNATLSDVINNELELAVEHQEKITELSKLTESTFESLKKTGVLSNNAAKMLSTLIPAWADTITQDTQVKPEQLIKEFGLKIEGAYKGLEEKNMDGIRGSYNTQTKTINLGNDQDLTTFLHETAHFFLDVAQTICDISRIAPIIPITVKDLRISELEIRDNFNNPDANP